MKVEEILGKTITNIYSLVEMEVGGLDTGECFVELDGKFIIDIPSSFSDEVFLKDLNKDAESLFTDISANPTYSVEITLNDKSRRRNIFSKLYQLLFMSDSAIKNYQPQKIEYGENKLKHVKNRKIVDLIGYLDDDQKHIILLENGYLITETTVTNHGTGLAGLNLYESISDLISAKGNKYIRLTERKDGN